MFNISLSPDQIPYLTITDPGKVWMPDTFFRNERRGAMHNVLVPNLYVRLYADGTVLFSIRVSLTLSCPMNLKMYPLDTQKCPMQIASCKFSTSWYFILDFVLNNRWLGHR